MNLRRPDFYDTLPWVLGFIIGFSVTIGLTR